MSSANYDVVIVGCGPAGVSAAIGLARADFSVLVLEGAPFAGAENWSGAIYFTENLAHPDLLGGKGVEELPFERRITRRGMLMSNGHSSFGLSYRNAETFANNYSVLRPTYDHYLSEVAKSFGATILTETTATSLIRHRGKIIGVNTDRGPFYTDLVFLAEGDASHLVSQEGYERLKEPAQPHFLQGIREVIPMSPDKIEQLYNVGAGEGAAFEILLRNGAINGRTAQLNIGGFIYTNADSLSVGLVLPLDNLAHNFSGDHNRLMEWFKSLPEIQRLIGREKSIGYGAKIIRGGGLKEIPTLIDHGLAIGGAASGIGTDFPYPNFTGPATFMGLQIARAAREIRRSGGEFTRENLERHYLAPLRASHYYKNVEYLRDWPAYVERTTFFFGRHLDGDLGRLYVLSRPDLNPAQKFWHAAKFSREAIPLKHLAEALADLRTLKSALRLSDIFKHAAQSLAFRNSETSSFIPYPSSFDFHYSVEGRIVPFTAFPFPYRRFFTSSYTQRAMSAAANALYRNDEAPLEKKLRRALELCLRGVCPLDLALAVPAKITILALMPLQWLAEKIHLLITRPTPEKFLASFYQRYLTRTRSLTNLSEGDVKVAQPFEEKLAMDTYFSEKTSHIHVLRPDTFEHRADLPQSALWHICPAKVYEVHPDDVGQSQVTVNFDNCVKCETCWRASPDVDWSRTRRQRLIYRVSSPASEKLFAKLSKNGSPTRPPKTTSPFQPSTFPPFQSSDLIKLRAQLEAFRSTLAHAPRALTHDDQAWLQQLAFNASSVGQDADRAVRKTLPADAELFTTLWSELRQRLAQMQVNVHRKKFFWADADAAQILDHHLPALVQSSPALSEVEGSSSNQFRHQIRARLDAAFDKQSIKHLEKGEPLTDPQLACLRDLANSLSPLPAGGERVRVRGIILEELARKDPSLAFLISHHWLASALLIAKPDDGQWRSLAFHGNANKKIFVLTALAEEFAIIEGDKLFRLPRAAVQISPIQTLGLTAAKAAHIAIQLPAPQSSVPPSFQSSIVSDLLSIALGAGRYLLERALAHAQSRVQFPATFRDEDGRDTIAKFGAVKQMLSEMEADVYQLETLSLFFSGEQGRDARPRASESTIGRASGSSLPIAATALLLGELIGTQPGSLAYNCGQVFGGTAYSEDDVISKFYRDSAAFAFMLGRDIEQSLSIAADFAAGKFPVASTPDELALFEDAARRGALRYPIENLIAEAKKLGEALRHSGIQALRSPVGHSAARWWGTKLALLRTAAQLERGEDARKQVECCRLLADRAAQSQIISSESLGLSILSGGYPDQPLRRPIPFSYSALCRAEQTYDFGDYLLKPFGSLAARYLPEHLHLDKELAAYNARVRAIFEELSRRVTDGLQYSRQIEKLHAVPDSEIQMLLREGFMRMFIPKELGGEGRHKAEYYILVTHSMRYGEPGIALTIQAHQSIGVTPMILGLNQDIPRAKHELQEFLADDSLVKKLDREIAQMLADVHTPAVLKIKAKFSELGDFVRTEIGKRASIRGIAADFIEAFMTAGRAGLRMDLKSFEENLKKAQAILPKFNPRAEAELAELTRREEAHKQFLRYIASGAISCFALTEPSAGSDTASVGTRAVLRHAEVFTDKDGTKFFWLDEKKTQRRKIIDAAKWNLRPPPPDADVGQIRKGADREFYEYYELNGAKMWITNAHIAGAMAMYAKTEVGPTGFMLRAPVEGLTVGNDELKMGQRGSPTNELGLSGVRVPRENIIGIEGRGQVNALETLNAGRMGLSVSSMAMMQKIIEQTRAFVAEHKLGEVPWVHELLGQMTEELYAVESLAFELIGLFDHKGTRNARVESAIGKYHGAEALHRVIRAAMSIHGILGQTAQYEIEKHLRDARILNIYEGTNEVQRFLILRDLVETLLPKWKQKQSGADVPSANRDQGQFSLSISTLESSKTRLFRVLDTAAQLFGAQIWNNPNFQPTFFPLAEIASLLKVCDSILARTLWLSANIADSREPSDKRHLQLAEASAQNFLARTFAEMDRLFARVEHQLDPNEHYHQILRRGFYPPEIRIATLALREGEASAEPLPEPRKSFSATKPMQIVVVLQPQPVLSPRPQVRDGQLIEPYFTLPPADCHALALALRTGARVTVLARGPAFVQNALRRALAAGADDAVWICDEAAFTTPSDAARQISEALTLTLSRQAGEGKSLVIAGDDVIASALASRLHLESVAGVADFSLCHSERSEESLPSSAPAIELHLAALPDRTVAKKLPLVLSVAPADEANGLSFDSSGYLASFAKPLRRVEAKPAPPVQFALPEFAGKAAEAIKIDSPEAAAKLFLAEARVGGASTAETKSYDGSIADISAAELFAAPSACFVSAGEISGEMIGVASAIAAHAQLPLRVLAICEADESRQRAMAAQAIAGGAAEIVLLPVAGGVIAGSRLVCAALEKLKPSPLVLGSETLNTTFAASGDAAYNLILGAKSVAAHNGTLIFSCPAFGGKLTTIHTLRRSDAPTFITLAAGVAVVGRVTPRGGSGGRVVRLALDLGAAGEPDEIERLLAEARAQKKSETIKDAEFLIDVGYAIRTREQFEQIVTPLEKALKALGVPVMIGGTRKVVEELKLLRHDQQIGQTGTPVNPRIILALGVSGAPQHVDYIGERAVIFAFNKDADAPLMTLNQRRKAPKVYPIVGDLYETVPRFLAALLGSKNLP